MGCQVVDGHRFESTGELRLLDAHIGGQLNVDGASLSNETDPALISDGLQVDRSMFCQAVDGHRFESTGELRLLDAHIGGQLNVDGASLSNETDPALISDGLQVDRSMFCQAVDGHRFESTGELRLLDAHIGGQLNVDGASLSNETDPALISDGLQVDRSMFCQAVDGHRFESTGELRLLDSHIGGQLNVDGASLSNETDPALTADGLQFDRSMVCQVVDGHRFESIGELLLLDAHIGGQLNVDGASLSNETDP